MALIQVYDNQNHSFEALSTDISSNKIAGLDFGNAVGEKVYITDLEITYTVNPDFTLSPYIINSDLQVSDIQIGSVELKDSDNENRASISNDGSINVLSSDIISGTATGGSKSTIVDTSKNLITNMLTGSIAEIDIGSTKYFREVLSNTVDTITINTIAGNPASASIGSGSNGVVTVTSANDGIGGNSYTLQGVLGEGNNVAMSVLLTGLNLVVTLGTNGGGTIDASKNTATLIASAIDALEQFTAVASGTGADSINPSSVINFTGGVAIVACSSGDDYRIRSKKPIINTSNKMNTQSTLDIGGNIVTPLIQVPTNVSEFELSKEITISASASVYTAKDIINADSATTLPELDFGAVIGSASTRKIQINSIQITSSNGAASTKLIPEVILYNANTLTGQTLTDNTAFNPTYAQHVLKKATAFSKQENWITGDFNYGNFYECRLTEVIRNATLDSLGKLYLALIATNAYTPSASEKFTITIKFYLLN